MNELVSLDLWAGRGELQLPFDPERERLWILAGGHLRREELTSLLDERLLHATTIMTLERLNTRLLESREDSLELLSRTRSQALLRRLILDPGRFPLLAEHHRLLEQGSGALVGLLYEVCARLRRFEGHDLTEILSSCDGVIEGPSRDEELRALCRLHEQEQERLGQFDASTAQLMLCRRLEAGDGVALLPDVIILDQPDGALAPLDGRLLRALATHCRFFIVVDAAIAELSRDEAWKRPGPSLDHVQQLARFLAESTGDIITVRALEDVRGEAGQALSAALFDGGAVTPLSAPGLELWSCHDHRAEVNRAVRRIKHGMREQGWRPEQIHITVPELETHSALLEELFAAAELPLSIPKGRPFSVSPAAGRLKELLEWAASGTNEAMFRYYTSPGLLPPSLGEEALESFLRRFQRASLEQLNAELEQRGATIALDGPAHSFNAHRLHVAMRKAQQRGGLDFTKDWLDPLLVSLRHRLHGEGESPFWTVRVLLDLAALERPFFQELMPLRDPELPLDRGLALIREMLVEEDASARDGLFTNRIMTALARTREAGIPPPLGHAFEQEAMNTVRVFHEIGVMLDEISAEAAFRRQQGWIERGLGALRRRISEALSRRYTTRRPSAGSIIATELRDARLKNPGIMFCLGLTAAALSRAALTVEVESGEKARAAAMAERRWSLGRLIRQQPMLILSAPRIESNEEAPAATVLADLRRWRDSGRLELEAPRPPARPYQAPRWRGNGVALLQQRVERGVALIEARAGPTFTAFDGDVGSLGLAEDEPSVYSPTTLEILADCPHRHFFNSMVYLKEFPEVEDELPRHELGSVVHACLELFWTLSDEWTGWTGGPITAENFDEACQFMRGLALKVLDEWGIDWSRGPLRRADRRLMMTGLDEPGDTGPRGMLKAALAFQRDLPYLSGPPFRTEMPFGTVADKDPVPITDKVSARGIIDRLDLLHKSAGQVQFMILDYKTGYAKSIREVEQGTALQIPFYALVVREVFKEATDEGAPRVRGGLLTLKEPNRRKGEAGNRALDHPLHGVYREHLTATKAGRSWVCSDDEAVTERNLENARKRLDELDRRVRDGRFHQEIFPKACPYCAYRDICFHDEATLIDKHENDTNPEPEAELMRPVAAEKKPRQRKTRSAQRRSGRLSNEQERAAEASRSASVSAGAGSGKTFILKSRVARLIRAGVPVASILAITFTEKAAAEIRERIEQALGEALDQGHIDEEPLDEAERALIVRARSDMALASIATIHAFCHEVLAMDPILSGVDLSHRVVSGPELHELENEVLRQLFAHDSPVAASIEKLLSQGIATGTLRRELRRRLSNRSGVKALQRVMGRPDEDWDALFPKLQDTLLREQIMPLGAFLDEWQDAAVSWASSDAGLQYLSTREPREQEFHALLESVGAALEALSEQRFTETAGHLCGCLERMKSVNRAVAFTRSKKLPRNYWMEIRDVLDKNGLTAPKTSFTDEHQAIASARCFLEVVTAAQAFYQGRKRESGLLDFEDLIEKVHVMFQAPASEDTPLAPRRARLLSRLHERFQHILVDEFQDTDRRQWEIIRTLMERPEKNGAPLSPTTFIVGDAKQSIYGWRNSDNRVFEEACRVLGETMNGRHLVLADNYRSGLAVLDWVNAFFEQVFDSEFDPTDPTRKLVDTAVRAQPMRVAGDQPSGSVHILRIRARSSKSAEPYSEETLDEFASIAALIEDILGSAENTFAVRPHSGPRIGVLCRTTRTLRAMARALDRLSIPYSSTHRAGFFTGQAVMVMETALRALVFEKDEVSLAGLLRGPLIGWSDRDLLDAKQALYKSSKERKAEEAEEETEKKKKAPRRRWLEMLCTGDWDDDRGRAFSALYQRWKNAASCLSPSALLRLIIADSGIDLAYASTDRMPALRDIWRLLEMIEEVERELGLVELLDWMHSQRLTAPEGAALAPAEDIPVVLTTIHGAKGLEFPIVILPGLGRRSLQEYDFLEVELPGEKWPSLGLRTLSAEAGYRRIDTVLSSILKRRSQARTRSEEKRLFYVACTRAAQHLILPIVARRADARKGQLDEEARRHELRFAKSHRELLMALGRPDDSEQPNLFDFETGPEQPPLEVPVIEVEERRR